ncbi:hypothetical protein C1H46_008598 [Malus baccata]|uniref:Armadillo repeat-containing domain-containing protein n=1 Tax=Malus baccata TaxID=106549 RepID=A0A540N446_MALBA|nr:hypothetical protein C1H46_008598 [Malus baccata]
MIQQLVAVVEIEARKQAAMEIRLLTKNKSENRLKIARNVVIKPLISLLLSSNLQFQEYGVTAILNLCARTVVTGTIKCWRVNNISKLPSGSDQFSSISSGSGFSGGISKATLRVRCWGKATAWQKMF